MPSTFSTIGEYLQSIAVVRLEQWGLHSPAAELRVEELGVQSHDMTVLLRQEHMMVEARGWAEAGQLFAILDACDTPSVVDKVKELGAERAVSLYRGTAEEELKTIAPYLVVVDAAVFDWITETLCSEPWGVFVRAASTLEKLRTHFRKFLLVEGPMGEEWYFRFYDPRVLTAYLPACDSEELSEVFGPVESFVVGDPAAGVLSLSTRDTEARIQSR